MPRLLLRPAVVAAVGFVLAGGVIFALDAGGLRSRLLLKLRPPVVQSLADPGKACPAIRGAHGPAPARQSEGFRGLPSGHVSP